MVASAIQPHFLDSFAHSPKTEEQVIFFQKLVQNRVKNITRDMAYILAKEFKVQHQEVVRASHNIKTFNKVINPPLSADFFLGTKGEVKGTLDCGCEYYIDGDTKAYTPIHKLFDRDVWNKRIAKAVRKMIFLSALDGFSAGRNIQKGGYYFEEKKASSVQSSIGFTEDNAGVSDWLDSYTMKFSDSINSNIQKGLDKIVSEAIVEEGSTGAIRKRIQDEINAKYSYIYGDSGGKTIPMWKAYQISQTETAAAQNAGNLAGLISSKVVEYKGWMSRRNSKVRPDHVAADSEYTRMKGIPLTKNFTIGSGKSKAIMSAPGVLVSGNVGQRINCGCILIAAKKGSGSGSSGSVSEPDLPIPSGVG